jgi:hypothetical protein
VFSLVLAEAFEKLSPYLEVKDLGGRKSFLIFRASLLAPGEASHWLVLSARHAPLALMPKCDRVTSDISLPERQDYAGITCGKVMLEQTVNSENARQTIDTRF